MKTSPPNPIHLLMAAMALVTLLSQTGCAAQQAHVGAEERLFTDASPKGKIDEAMRSSSIRYRFVTVNLHRITGPEKTRRYSKTLELNLFDDAIFTAVLDRLEVLSETSVVWLGYIEGVEDSQVTLVVNRGVMAGSIRARQSLYQVNYNGEGTHVLYEIDPTAFPPESKPVVPPDNRR